MPITVENVSIRGISSSVPADHRPIKDETGFDAKEIARFSTITGVVDRRNGRKRGICTSDLCFSAAGKLLEELDWAADSIDVLIFVSQSRDYVFPMTACILHDRLGLKQSCLAIDIPSGCTGFIHGLVSAASMLNGSNCSRALLLAGEVNDIDESSLYDSSRLLWGDAGTACALEFNPNASQMHFEFGTLGKDHKVIYIPASGFREPLKASDFDYVDEGDGVKRRRVDNTLDGAKVFEFAISTVPESINALLENIRADEDDIDYFIFHQANRLLNETVRKRLNIRSEKVPFSIEQYGNTSSASIALTMTVQLATQLESQKQKLVLCGFGVGLSWGAAFIQTDKIVCPDLVEL